MIKVGRRKWRNKRRKDRWKERRKEERKKEGSREWMTEGKRKERREGERKRRKEERKGGKREWRKEESKEGRKELWNEWRKEKGEYEGRRKKEGRGEGRKYGMNEGRKEEGKEVWKAWRKERENKGRLRCSKVQFVCWCDLARRKRHLRPPPLTQLGDWKIYLLFFWICIVSFLFVQQGHFHSVQQEEKKNVLDHFKDSFSCISLQQHRQKMKELQSLSFWKHNKTEEWNVGNVFRPFKHRGCRCNLSSQLFNCTSGPAGCCPEPGSANYTRRRERSE